MKHKTPQIAGYATRAEIAKRLGKTPRTLIRWYELQIGPPVTLLGRTPVYSEESFRAWLLANEEKPRRARRASPARRSRPARQAASASA